MRALAPRSAMGVPIIARGRLLGVITFMAAESGRRYGPAELRLAEDLAHRVALAMDNARLYREAQETDRLKDEFLGMLAHELRNPLAAISNTARLLLLRQIEDPVLQRHRGVLERQVGLMTRLLDDLLEVSRLTRGRIGLRPQEVDLGALMEQAVEASRGLIEERRHQMEVTLPPAPIRLRADPVRLLQVLSNLLTNAARYTEPGGQISVSAGAEGEAVVLRVRDTGVGISAEMLPRVFDLFVQADRSLDRSEGGLGVGLTIARRLVELHGGSIFAFSEGPSQGSEFVVRLPAEQATGNRVQATGDRGQATVPGRPLPKTSPESVENEAPPTTALALSTVVGRLSPGAKRILVVDDNADAAESMADVLDIMGYDARLAHDGPTALETARAYQPQVVLLDIGLPGMNGYEVALRLRAEAKGHPPLLIALTGYSAREDRERAKDVGFDQYLTKPVELMELERLLSSADDRQSPERTRKSTLKRPPDGTE
jgi:signal transduction histidine kinase/CheY-like chemotaxis protein